MKSRARLLYRLLIWLYPPSMRREFCAEMLDLAEARAVRNRMESRRWSGLRTWGFLARDSLRALPEAYSNSARSYLSSRVRRDGRPRLSLRERILLVLGDLRYAFRNLGRSRGFALAAILTLALGIGANTAIFSVVNGVILRPLPYNDPDELVSIGVIWEGGSGALSTISQPDLRDVQSQVGSIESAAGFSASELTLTGMGNAEAIRGAHVTDGLLEVFQETTLLGRDIRTEENIPDGPRVVLIGHAFWQERMGGTANVLGQTIQLDGAVYEIVGVAPKGFDYPRNAQVWVPYYLNEEDCGRGCQVFSAVGRMREGSTIGVARNELSALSLRLQEQYTESNYGKSLGIMSMEEDVVGDVRTALLVLLGAVGMVLLIACANVANLLLARATVRAGEMAMRSALGAARGRLVQQLLLEASVLAAIAGVLGVALSSIGVSTLLRLAPASIPRLDNVGVDGLVLLFAFGTVIMITLLFGLVPALRLAKTSVASVLNQSGRGKSGSANQDWSRSALLVAEVAFSLMLLFGAGLLLRSFSKLQAVELGFDRDRVLTFRLSLPEIPYDGNGDATVRFFETLEDRIAEIPGVERVGSAFGSPLGGSIASTSAEFLDRPAPPEGQEEVLVTRIATPGYHETLKVPLLSGRAIERTDRNGVTRAAMVSQSLVDKYYPDSDPIGQQIRMGFGWAWGTEEPWTIVGVVGDIRSLRVTRAPRPEIYLSHGQMGATSMSVLVRLAPNAPDVLPAIRREVQALDPNVPLRRIEMLDETVDRQFGPARFYMLLLSIFAAVAVALAGIGLYGVIGYLVSQRTREIGIRIALGAKGADVIRMVLSQGIKPAAVGIGLGVAGAYWSSRVLQSLLYNVETSDITTFTGVTVMLALVVLLAIVMPARKASQIPPVDALRVE